LQLVLWVACVTVAYFSEIHIAVSAPARMVIGLAGHTMLSMRVWALTGPVGFCTVAANVVRSDALIGVVVPSLALQAAGRFLFDLLCSYLLVAYCQSIRNNSVGREGVSE